VAGDPINHYDPSEQFSEVPDPQPDPFDPGPQKPQRPIPADPRNPTLSDLIKASMGRIRLDLRLRSDCAGAIGAKSTQNALNGLSISVGFSNHGAMQVITNPAGDVVGTNPDGPGSARYFPGVLGIGKSIRVNSRVNWFNPNATIGVDQNGNNATYKILDATAYEVGAASGMSIDDFMDLTLLHEIAHSFGVEHPADNSQAADTKIWNDCVKGN
jgi:hypothetical protein